MIDDREKISNQIIGPKLLGPGVNSLDSLEESLAHWPSSEQTLRAIQLIRVPSGKWKRKHSEKDKMGTECG